MRYQQEADYIIHLLKCAIDGKTPLSPNVSLDWDVIFDLARRHKIISTLYFSIIKLPKDIIETIKHFDTYTSLYKRNLILDANRSYELNQLQSALESNKIDYIFLKGSVIKNYYPDTAMRHMNDIDILFRNANFKTIDSIFEKFGYKTSHKTAKDTAYTNPANHVTIEMQSHLIDRGYSDWYQYLENIWDKCTHENHEYKMTSEDFYIYHMIHMAKHFKNGGIGLTHILDIHIMTQNFTSIDWEYVNSKLSQLGLYQFSNTMKTLTNHWFNSENTNNSFTKELELIATYIFSGGAFGSKKQQETNAIVSRGDAKFSIRKKLFPNMTTMVNYYGDFLNKHKYLLPVYWVKLNFNRLANYKPQKKDSFNHISSITEFQISATKEIMDICGLK